MNPPGGRFTNPDPNATKASIRGRVTSGVTGQPVGGVRVHLLGGDPCCTTFLWTDTDAQGNYVLEIAPGQYIVQFSPNTASGYVFQYWNERRSMFTSTPVVLGSGGVNGIDAKLEAGFLVNVRLTDATGNAASGHVYAYAPGNLANLDYMSGSSSSFPGTYSIRLLNGNYRIGVFPPMDPCCPGSPPVQFDVLVNGQDQTVNARLP